MAEPIKSTSRDHCKPLTPERARELLIYDAITGSVRWRAARYAAYNGREAGRVATAGHRQINLDGHSYQLHRVIWLMVYERWPVGDVDHKNRCKTDNWIDNLREGSRSQNCGNQAVRKNSGSGIKGVYQRESGRWRALIMKDYRRHNLGTFGTQEEAAAAYERAAKQLFGEFSRTS